METEIEHEEVLDQRRAELNKKFHDLIQLKSINKIFTACNYSYPTYNFSDHEIPSDLLDFMRKYRPESAIFGFKVNELSTMAEVDCLAGEVQDLYSENETQILQEQHKFRQIRKHFQSFMY